MRTPIAFKKKKKEDVIYPVIMTPIAVLAGGENQVLLCLSVVVVCQNN